MLTIVKRSSWRTRLACALIFALIFALAALPGVGPALRAQDSAAHIAVDLKGVTLPVTVRTKEGQIVSDLTKDDFTLQEDGRAQTIHYFSHEANLPLTLGLLVDTSRSQTNVLDAERNASRGFFDQMLVQPKDKAFLIHFDREVELLQDLTSSRENLLSPLDLLNTPPSPYSPTSRSSTDPPHSDDSDSRSGSASHHRDGPHLYDALFLPSKTLMKN